MVLQINQNFLSVILNFCSLYSVYLVVVNCDIVHVLGVILLVDRVMIGNI